ncbi:MAG TPA: alpha/beta hydrolase [Cytophagales bacterium]|nr:alpha/beta hydrolase [Cytophagales bacterium]HAP59219.1 alpha/beta hydrolase [Cytophagales bacterium]
METTELTIPLAEGTTSALWLAPDQAKAQFVFAHGAGAGMRHVFMEEFSLALAQAGIATLRWQFPYMEKGSKRPDSPKIALAAWEAVAQFASQHSPLPLWVGGKSFGGRMASLAAAEERLPKSTKGIIYVGFPLHAAGKPGTQRAAHLADIPFPMLFLQGTRDALADLSLLEPLLAPVATATLAIFEGADHSFKTLKRLGITEEAIREEMIDRIATWVAERV